MESGGGRAKRLTIGISLSLMILAITIWQSIRIASCVRDTRGVPRGASRYRRAGLADAATDAPPRVDPRLPPGEPAGPP